MPEAVQVAGLRDGVRGPRGGGQQGPRRHGRTVMRRHHQVHRRQRRRERGLLDQPHVAGQQRAVADAFDQQHATARIAAAPGQGRGKRRRIHEAQADAVDAPLHARLAPARRRRHARCGAPAVRPHPRLARQPRRQIEGRVGLPHRQGRQHAAQPAGMVQVGMRHHQGIDMAVAARPQERGNHALAGVRGVAVSRPGIEQQHMARGFQHHGAALAHVQRGQGPVAVNCQ
ncbi:Uncharacterised protein [Bordetella pertussis]|nr:Uncharacterised protein [Bordetella pertussis]CPP43965.1 Uncharacterised protein [Bordetella pertussis]CPQ64420.1 Uncharacterised protein [Bordetella pertussis]CPR04681.1 Uncharacterised protein [Bordetella pertussis]